MDSLQILLFLLCIYDLYKNKKILSPTFLFNFVFFISYSLYQWDFSYIQQKLSSRTQLVFFNCVVFYNITYIYLKKCFNKDKFILIINKLKNKILVKNKKDSYQKFSINKRIRIAKYIAIIIFIIEMIYSRGCPLIWKFTGDPRTYFDFGIPSLNGAFYGLIICLGAYSLFSKSNDKYLYLAMGILMISRQVIISIVIEGVIFLILKEKNNINYKKILIILIIVFIGFTFVGNFRSGKEVINEVFQPKKQYKTLPDSIKWSYSYMTFSISNFNNLVNMSEGNVNHGTSILSEFLPTVLLNKINIKPEFDSNYLISQSYNVSTYLPSIYLDFGIVGVAIFNVLIAIIGFCLYDKVSNSDSKKYILMYSVFAHNIILLFFINMFLYLPILIQFLYIPLIFADKNKKTKNKNILFIGTDSNMSGASLCMVSLAKEIKDNGYNPIIVLPSLGDGMLYEYITNCEIKCHIVKSFNWVALLSENKFKKMIKYKIKQIYNLYAIWKIEKIIENNDIDIVHINSLFSYVGAKSAIKKDTKIVWHIREILEYGHNADFYNNKKAYKLINKSDKIITISKYVYDYYKKHLNKDKMEIIYDGIEIEKYYNENKTIFKNSSVKFMLAATIQESKGQEEFLNALSFLKKEGFDKFKAILVGYATEENKNKLLGLIKKLNLTKNVEYLGFKKDIVKYWNDTDIAFMCSSGEAFGRTTVEACLCGCLVIGANIGATSEIIDDKITGLLYESKNAQDLKNKIMYAIDNKSMMKKIAKEGRKKSKEKFDSMITTKKVIELYKIV